MKKFPTTAPGLWSVFVLLCLLLIGPGCSDDSDLVEPGVNPIPDRISPLHAWNGLQWSLDQSEDSGWTEAIGSSFEYIPDPVCSELYPSAFEGWDRETELAFVLELFLGDLELSGQMMSPGFEPPQPTGATVVWEGVEYFLQVDGADGTSPVTFGGVARLSFRLEGNFWYLESWADLEGGRASWNSEIILPTLGQLRGAYGVEP